MFVEMSLSRSIFYTGRGSIVLMALSSSLFLSGCWDVFSVIGMLPEFTETDEYVRTDAYEAWKEACRIWEDSPVGSDPAIQQAGVILASPLSDWEGDSSRILVAESAVIQGMGFKLDRLLADAIGSRLSGGGGPLGSFLPIIDFVEFFGTASAVRDNIAQSRNVRSIPFPTLDSLSDKAGDVLAAVYREAYCAAPSDVQTDVAAQALASANEIDSSLPGADAVTKVTEALQNCGFIFDPDVKVVEILSGPTELEQVSADAISRGLITTEVFQGGFLLNDLLEDISAILADDLATLVDDCAECTATRERPIEECVVLAEEVFSWAQRRREDLQDPGVYPIVGFGSGFTYIRFAALDNTEAVFVEGITDRVVLEILGCATDCMMLETELRDRIAGIETALQGGGYGQRPTAEWDQTISARIDELLNP